MVVGFDVEAADADQQQAEPGGVGVDVGGVHDPCQAHQRWVGVEVVAVDEYLEASLVALMSECCTGSVEAVALLACGDGEPIGGGNVEKLGGGVDELGDQPWARDPVGLRAGPCHPFHVESPDSCAGWFMPVRDRGATHGDGARRTGGSTMRNRSGRHGNRCESPTSRHHLRHTRQIPYRAARNVTFGRREVIHSSCSRFAHDQGRAHLAFEAELGQPQRPSRSCPDRPQPHIPYDLPSCERVNRSLPRMTVVGKNWEFSRSDRAVEQGSK